jgi:hypothetical protein
MKKQNGGFGLFAVLAVGFSGQKAQLDESLLQLDNLVPLAAYGWCRPRKRWQTGEEQGDSEQ